MNNKPCRLSVIGGAALAVAVLVTAEAQAQQPVNLAPGAVHTAAPSSAPVGEAAPSMAPQAASQVIAPAQGAMPAGAPMVVGAPASGGHPGAPNAPGAIPPADPLSPMGEGPVIPSSTKDVVSGLQGAKAVSLEDVTKAQDALARLQLLLEIEEKMLQIEKVRNDRKKEASGGAMAAMIPAASLQIAPPAPSSVDMMPVPSRGAVKRRHVQDDEEEEEPAKKTYKVDQITGVQGRYQAIMSSEDGKTIPVHAGDKLPDGTLVRSVTLQGVMVKHGKKTELLGVQTASRLITGVRSSDD